MRPPKVPEQPGWTVSSPSPGAKTLDPVGSLAYVDRRSPLTGAPAEDPATSEMTFSKGGRKEAVPKGESMRRALLLLVLSSSLLLLAAAPAQALTKVRSPLALLTEPTVVEGFCPFPVTYQDIQGSGTQTLTFDADGNLVRIDLQPHGVISQVSANGNTITFNNSGPVSIFPQPDGTDLVVLRGRSFEADQGLLTGDAYFHLTAGRVVVVSVFNPATGFNDFLSTSGVGLVTDLCAALAA